MVRVGLRCFLAAALALQVRAGAATATSRQPMADPLAALRSFDGSAIESTRYPFQGNTDGDDPMGTLTVDTSGNIYGTTWEGGLASWGTVFKLTTTGSASVKTILHGFTDYSSGDGAFPAGTLISDAKGALYGTTWAGGIFGGVECFDSGCGTVFKLTPSGSGYKERILYSFQGGDDGSNPYGGVVAGKDGAFYGTTEYSGSSFFCESGCGTVFKLTPTQSGYTESVLHRFQGGKDGGNPEGALLVGEHGTLYGTTHIGGTGCQGYGCGVVFTVARTRAGYKERVVYRFHGSDGAGPKASLIADSAGALYGTTSGGGETVCYGGCGIVFRLSPAGDRYREDVLYRFVPPSNPSDGYYPQGALVEDKSGDLYSTTYYGGGKLCNVGCGTVFELMRLPSGGYAEGVLYAFHGTRDGAFPYTGLAADKSGVLYGTTSQGGGGGGMYCGHRGWQGCGVVFKVIL